MTGPGRHAMGTGPVSVCHPVPSPPLCSTSTFSWAPRPCLPTARARARGGIQVPPEHEMPSPPAPTPLPSRGHDAVLLLLVIKKIFQLPFHGCLATPKQGGGGGPRGGGEGEGSGANLETKSRIWVTWSPFVPLTWPGWDGGRGRAPTPTPVPHTNKYGLGKWAEFFPRA